MESSDQSGIRNSSRDGEYKTKKTPVSANVFAFTTDKPKKNDQTTDFVQRLRTFEYDVDTEDAMRIWYESWSPPLSLSV